MNPRRRLALKLKARAARTQAEEELTDNTINEVVLKAEEVIAKSVEVESVKPTPDPKIEAAKTKKMPTATKTTTAPALKAKATKKTTAKKVTTTQKTTKTKTTKKTS